VSLLCEYLLCTVCVVHVPSEHNIEQRQTLHHLCIVALPCTCFKLEAFILRVFV